MIQIKNVDFHYPKGGKVFKDLSLDIEEGKICGLLGSNGTGKSTLLYLIMGLLRPKHGEVLVDGLHSSERRVEMLREVFLVPEEFDLPSMRLRSYLNLIRPLYPKFSDEILRSALQGFDLPLDLNLGQLSMGQKKKAFMCIALATNTKYLLMDEPTNGLDIVAKSQFRKIIVSSVDKERSVIISTHQVHDVEKLLDHLVVIKESRVLYNAPLEESEDEPIDLERMYMDIVVGGPAGQKSF